MDAFNDSSNKACAQALATLAEQGLPVAQLLNGYRANLEADLLGTEQELLMMQEVHRLVLQRVKMLQTRLAVLQERVSRAQPWMDEDLGEESTKESVAD